MTIIAPSLLSSDFLNLQSELQILNNIENLWIHLDIMDGHFVPNLTFGTPIINQLKSITSHKLDAHFMVTNPQFYADSWANYGLHNFTFHWETVTHHDKFISHLKSLYPSVGIALNPSTPINTIPSYLFKKIDLILIMSVNPGFSGQSFIEGVMDKIRFFAEVKKSINPSLEIQVDGGISDQNAKLLIQSGATNLVSGSYIFSEKNKNYQKQIDSLRL